MSSNSSVLSTPVIYLDLKSSKLSLDISLEFSKDSVFDPDSLQAPSSMIILLADRAIFLSGISTGKSVILIFLGQLAAFPCVYSKKRRTKRIKAAKQQDEHVRLLQFLSCYCKHNISTEGSRHVRVMMIYSAGKSSGVKSRTTVASSPASLARARNTMEAQKRAAKIIFSGPTKNGQSGEVFFGVSGLSRPWFPLRNKRVVFQRDDGQRWEGCKSDFLGYTYMHAQLCKTKSQT